MQERECRQGVVGIARASGRCGVETGKIRIRDGEALPAVGRELRGSIHDHLAVVGDIIFQNIHADGRHVRELKVHGVAKTGAVIQRDTAAVVVLVKAVVHVVERETVFENVLGGRASAAEFEAVAVAAEATHAPEIQAIGERPAVLERDGDVVVVEIPTVVRVIPGAAATENVTFSGACLG